MLKELELMTGAMLGQKAVKDRTTQFGVEQQAATARLQIKVRYYEDQAAPCSTPLPSEKNTDNEESKDGVTGSDGGRGKRGGPERV